MNSPQWNSRKPNREASKKKKQEKRKLRIKSQMRADKKLHDKMLGAKPKSVKIKFAPLDPSTTQEGNETNQGN